MKEQCDRTAQDAFRIREENAFVSALNDSLIHWESCRFFAVNEKAVRNHSFLSWDG